ncbi:hypothetical protein EDD86DRAFT_245920 [Gorgonomyces haynaldii]|nr:hypothetical protein EDD86DRAFT_245920 [Gorgonomyces haynaldii]
MLFQALTDVAVLDPQSRIDIDDGLKSAFIRADGTFSLDLEPGSYKLDVLTGTHYFIPIRIDVQQETYQVFKLNQNNNWREHGPQLSVFEIEPVQPRQQFSVMSLLSNPMILMSVVTFGLFFLLPKLKDQIDPEALKEYQESKPTPQERK